MVPPIYGTLDKIDRRVPDGPLIVHFFINVAKKPLLDQDCTNEHNHSKTYLEFTPPVIRTSDYKEVHSTQT